MLPLQGITVVSIEQAVAAPFATRQLADLGARVIKVERPEGGDFARGYDTTVNGMSSHFTWLNRSKESITLNLKENKDKEVLERLLAQADVFIQNLAPGAMGRLGFDPEELLKKYPRLISVGISGYGSNGSYRDKKAYDLLIQCEAGAVSVTGTEETPSKTGMSIADIAAGMYAYTSVLTALLARNQTNKGDVIEISMLEALGEWMGYPMYYANYGGTEPKRTGASHATIYPYGPFTLKDGKTVFLGIQNEREWKQFCDQVLQLEELAEDPRFESNYKRVENREVLETIIEETFQQLTSEEVIQGLNEANIANARLNTMKEFMDHPQLKERKRWGDVELPSGERVKALIPPFTAKNLDYVMNPIPALGEHTDKILKEIGISRVE
ncbi:Crotonobetainyl-CoA:carnitine CoA-transferase CaiB [Alteribacillus persepolensis]|uniref:Crotonobetainyl-CoA:carnitine CoA-transferase CaiB n=1 Tax=Alteribacillus persepolensis TaxID=568899 RepID=A0A1G8EIZ7_9BACI|nr:CaiB/BaiF CoA-transferase family protein [Alteribacillus persepolensis]SDH69770.1 Crotonobetainyl-CoA:carnitine CoA-transferase CaiB [Alteribacillus persepolensis]